MIEAGDNLEVAKDKANAWSLEVEKKKTGPIPTSGKVDTTRYKYFNDICTKCTKIYDIDFRKSGHHRALKIFLEAM
jgi:hypothetical protein